MKKLKAWLNDSSADMKNRLATAAGVPKAYIHQVADGRRKPKLAITARLETALRKVDPTTTITRADLMPECKACPFYKSCKKEKS